MIATRQGLMGRHTAAPYAIVSMLGVVLTLWFPWAVWQYLCAGGEWVLHGGDLPMQMGLLVAFALAFGVWTTLHAFEFVGSGSGAGFRLVLWGIGSRIYVECVQSLGALWLGDTSATYGGPVDAVQMVWLVRNGALVAYGFGMTLVLLATATELRRRKHAPAWTRPAD